MTQQPSLGQHAQAVEHAVSDSVARAAGLGETWQTWRLIGAGIIALAAIAAVVVFVSEFLAVRKAGGLKAYARDFDTVNYGALRGIWTSEVIVGAVTVAILLHAFVPKLVSELQTDAVVTVFGFVGLFRGINFGAFFAKRATEDPTIMATKAAIADPTVRPLVTRNEKTGETTVSQVPVEVPAPAQAAAPAPQAPAQRGPLADAVRAAEAERRFMRTGSALKADD